MKITVLVENKDGKNGAGEVLAGEHGLSLFIEQKEKKILLDAGQSALFTENAKKLKIDLTKIDIAVLSHGHYDHSGGFQTVLTEYPHWRVYARAEAMGAFYSLRHGEPRYIGMDFPKEAREQIYFVKEALTELEKDIFLVAHRKADYSYFAEKASLYEKKGDRFLPDDFSHEQTLVMKGEKGLWVFSSCSHVGICNVVLDVKKAFPKEKIYGLMGGFHFLGKEPGKCSYSKEEVEKIADFLLEHQIEKVYTGHCTGEEGYAWLQEFLGNRIEALATGKIVEEG